MPCKGLSRIYENDLVSVVLKGCDSVACCKLTPNSPLITQQSFFVHLLAFQLPKEMESSAHGTQLLLQSTYP